MCEVWIKSGKVGLANMLHLLRWEGEVKTLEGLDLPAAGVKGAHVFAAEMKMAEQFVCGISAQWNSEDFKDESLQSVMEIPQKKAKAVAAQTVIQPEEKAPEEISNVMDLADLLRRRLNGKARKSSAPALETHGAKSASKDG